MNHSNHSNPSLSLYLSLEPLVNYKHNSNRSICIAWENTRRPDSLDSPRSRNERIPLIRRISSKAIKSRIISLRGMPWPWFKFPPLRKFTRMVWYGARWLVSSATNVPCVNISTTYKYRGTKKNILYIYNTLYIYIYNINTCTHNSVLGCRVNES